jgi:predicted dehydrogenase
MQDRNLKRIRVGLYGANGHQIHHGLAAHPRAELGAVAAFPDADCPSGCRRYATLDELLADPEIDLVSLCSPRRADQAADAIKSMMAGKHVYAEKPSALTESDLDAIISISRKMGRQFHEMGGSVMGSPYREMKAEIQSGTIGTVVQVLAQKSYPWAAWRPADEALDGGLALQVGIYVARFVEQVASVRIASMELAETTLGNTLPGSECRRAASFLMRLENGGLASGLANYLNPMQERCWGYEILRIFGTQGVVESNAEGARARIIPLGGAPRDLVMSGDTTTCFDLFVDNLLGGKPMPLSLEDELSPTRWVVRAKERTQDSVVKKILTTNPSKQGK